MVSSGVSGNSGFKSTDKVHALLTGTESSAVLSEVPRAWKYNVCFVVDNSRNIQRQANSQKNQFSNDCGIWDSKNMHRLTLTYVTTHNCLPVNAMLNSTLETLHEADYILTSLRVKCLKYFSSHKPYYLVSHTVLIAVVFCSICSLIQSFQVLTPEQRSGARGNTNRSTEHNSKAWYFPHGRGSEGYSTSDSVTAAHLFQ